MFAWSASHTGTRARLRTFVVMCEEQSHNTCMPRFISAVMEAPAALIKNGDVGDWAVGDAEFLAAFHLPGPAEKHDSLKELNRLPRDRRIFFDEERPRSQFLNGATTKMTFFSLMSI